MSQKTRVIRFWAFLGAGFALMVISAMMFFMAISYMEKAMVATSLLTAFIGFTTLSSSLYVLRLAAHVYGVEVGSSEKT